MKISCFQGISSVIIFLLFQFFFFLIHFVVLIWKDAKYYSILWNRFSSAKMNKCLTEYIHDAGGVDTYFIDGSYSMLYMIFEYKVPHIGFVMKTHISTVDRTGLVLSGGRNSPYFSS
jgi:hypothetical protein